VKQIANLSTDKQELCLTILQDIFRMAISSL